MKLYKTTAGFAIEANNKVYLSTFQDWDALINQDDLYNVLSLEIQTLNSIGGTEWLASQTILAPIKSQEIWAAGVTYLRSKGWY